MLGIKKKTETKQKNAQGFSILEAFVGDENREPERGTLEHFVRNYSERQMRRGCGAKLQGHLEQG